MADGETFDLGELAKEPHAKAGRGLTSDKSDEMRRDQIVAVEFLFDRTILFGKIDGGTDGGHQHQVVGIASDADRDRTLVDGIGRWGFTAVHLQDSSPL
jgi:hypothetical protein